MNGWHIALSEIRYNRLRSGLMAFGVLLTAAVMTVVVMLMIGVDRSISNTVRRLGADLMVVPAGEKVARQFNEALLGGRPAAFYLEPSCAEKIRGVPGVEAASGQVFVETLTNASCCAGKFFVVGFDPATDFTVTPWLKADSAALDYESEGWMIVGDRILLRQGQSAPFYGSTFTVAGVLEPTGMGMDWTVYVSEDALRKMVADSQSKAEMRLRIPEGAASAVFVRAESGVDLIDLAERIEQADPKVQVVLSSSVARTARGRMSSVATVLVCVVAALWVMSLLLNGGVFSQAVRERQGEIGLMAAKGAGRRFMFDVLAKESLLISIVSSALGCGIGLVMLVSLRQVLSDALGVRDVLPAGTTVCSLAVAFVGFCTISAVIAALLPVIPILRIEPYEAIKRGKTA